MFQRPRFPLSVAIVALLLIGPLAGRAAAAERPDDVYAVTLPVDVTAESAAEARRQALADGQSRSFRRLLERLTVVEDWWRLPEVPPGDLSFYLRDLAVANEKTSDVRYLADLTVRYRPPETRDLLRAHGIPFAETVSKPVLVLPVHGAGLGAVLWDEPNPWRAAWLRLPPPDGLVPMISPLGDLLDITGVTARDARDGRIEALRAMADRYGASDVVVAVADLGSADGGSTARIAVTRHGSDSWMTKSFVEIARAQPDETAATFLDRLAADVVRRIESEWKRDNLLNFESEGVLAVAVPIGSLGDWLAVRERLDRVAVIERAEVVILARDEARLNLHHIGSRDQLALALAQADLALRLEEKEWILRPPADAGPSDDESL